MAEPIPHADAAAAYVLGTLGSRERRRFEARLKKSPELQKVVRLLEAGSIGLALAAPRREPPIRLWAGIQTAVTHECEKRRRSAKRIWLHSAAGIAACTVIGWFAYTSWNQRASSVKPTIVHVSAVETTGKVTNSTPPVLARATLHASNLVSQPRERRVLRPGENPTLRERVGDLENQVANLAQTVHQQQAAPPDFNRLTFVSIVPEGSDGATSPQVAAPSPEVRRALLLGVARQLGWMPPTPAPPQSSALPPPSPASSMPPPSSPQPPEPAPPVLQTDAGVDFVDLPPVEAPSPETASIETSDSPTPTTMPTSTAEEPSPIPAFVSPTNVVLALNRRMFPTETLSLYSGSVFRGTVTLGNNPTVVTMPLTQSRTLDYNSSGWQPSTARFTYGFTSEGTVTAVRLVLSDVSAVRFISPDAPSTSP